MARPLLPTVDVEPVEPHSGSIIWLHGLGADGHDFEPIVPELGLPHVRFVFPHAPRRCVTVNMGMLMPAWYDITDLGTAAGYDMGDVRESEEDVENLIARETSRGIAPHRILLAGFSQGAAIALYAGLRHPEKLAGILALSTYLIEAEALATERSPANQSTPIFQAHGTHDPLLPLPLGQLCRRQLEELGYDVEFHTYPMAHHVLPEEIRDVAAWLSRRVPRTS
ncbi:MAG: alpha/beta fold hydrolase [Acidobacteriota bacterium]